MSHTKLPLPAFPDKDPGDDLDYEISFVPVLVGPELITLVNSVVAEPTGGPSDLTITGLAINGAATGVVFRITGGLHNRPYVITANVTTDTATRIYERSCQLVVRSL